MYLFRYIKDEFRVTTKTEQGSLKVIKGFDDTVILEIENSNGTKVCSLKLTDMQFKSAIDNGQSKAAIQYLQYPIKHKFEASDTDVSDALKFMDQGFEEGF